jgi:hypothetical protein
LNESFSNEALETVPDPTTAAFKTQRPALNQFTRIQRSERKRNTQVENGRNVVSKSEG